MDKPRKIFFLFVGRFPSEIIISFCAAKTAESFASAGVETEILVPRRFGRRKETPAKFFNAKDNYKTVYLPAIDVFKVPILGALAYYINSVTYTISAFFYLKKHAKKDDILYSNAHLPLIGLSPFFKNLFYEVHDYPEKKKGMYKRLFRACRWILVTNKWKLERLQEEYKIKRDKLFLMPNGVVIGDFDIEISKEEARKKLSLPLDKKIALYTGHLFSWKGVDTLGSVASLIPDIEIAIVGGREKDIKIFKEKYGENKNLTLYGYRRHEEIPFWQRAADVVILPNTAKEKISKYYTSPVKLFEYMASKTPIVASNIPSLTEILNNENAFLFEADNEEDLAKTIKEVLEDTTGAEKRARQARKDVEKYSWSKRGERIIEFISKN